MVALRSKQFKKLKELKSKGEINQNITTNNFTNVKIRDIIDDLQGYIEKLEKENIELIKNK